MSNTPLSPILSGKTTDVTPSALLAATASMTPEQKAELRANIGATDAETSIPDDVKVALLDCFAHVAWVDDQGQTYYDALEAALYPLASISAVYTPSSIVLDTDAIDSLKPYLVVTAVYEGGNTETVPAENYTLSGTLTVGTSTITISYGGKTTTFTATVKHNYADSLANWLLTATPDTAVYSDGVISLKCRNATDMSNYSVYTADRAKTLWSDVVGKTLKIRMKVKGDNFDGTTDRITFAVGIYADSEVPGLGNQYRLRSKGFDSIYATNDYQWYETTFVATLENMTGGSGTPTSVSTFGLMSYSLSLKTAYIAGGEIYEVDSE